MKRDAAIELKNKLTEEFRLLGFSLGHDPDEQVAATAPVASAASTISSSSYWVTMMIRAEGAI